MLKQFLTVWARELLYTYNTPVYNDEFSSRDTLLKGCKEIAQNDDVDKAQILICYIFTGCFIKHVHPLFSSVIIVIQN